VKAKSKRTPTKRYGHAAAMRGSKMWVFGGYDSDCFFNNDLWSFDFGALRLLVQIVLSLSLR
jgi:hypothetical protein